MTITWHRLNDNIPHPDSCNVCSADEYGLTALHYAAWNGHTDCVRYIAANPWGVNSTGERCSVLDLKSCKGYTALHIACIDCPSAKDIVKSLLVAGIDEEATDLCGKTAYDYAMMNDDDEAKTAFLELDSDEIESIQKLLYDNYTFGDNKRWNVIDRLTAEFPVPSFVYEEQERKPYIPKSLRVHEHHLLPLIEEGRRMRGVKGLKCLEFSAEESERNRLRRERILQSHDASWAPPVSDEDALHQKSQRKKVRIKGK